MKKISIRLPVTNPLKETQQSRRERLATTRATRTQVIQPKRYNRQKSKLEVKSLDCYD